MKILVTGMRAPVALHVAALLTNAGHEVTGADTFNSPLARDSHWVKSTVVYPSPVTDPKGFAAWFSDRKDDWDLIFPTCEEVFWIAMLAPDVTTFAPNIDTLACMHSKFDALRLAKIAGVPTPETIRVAAGEAIPEWRHAPTNTVLKPEFSRFADQVLVGPKQLKIPDTSVPWVMQERIRGEELCATAIVHAGEVMGFSCYRSALRAGRGAGILLDPSPIRAVEGHALLNAVDNLAYAAKYTGILSIDAISDGTSVKLIEINPRATSGLHFFREPAEFTRAVCGTGYAHPEYEEQVLGTAARTLHPWKYLTDRRHRERIKEAQEATDFAGSRPGFRRELQTAAHLARQARRERVSTLAGATLDIAWNGVLAAPPERKPVTVRKFSPHP